MGQWRDRLRALTARATNKIGQTQTRELIQNPAGYYHNLVQTLCDGSRFFALVLIPSSTRAEEQVVRLKQAPGLNAVEGQCGACHSLDYIVTNLPFLDAG